MNTKIQSSASWTDTLKARKNHLAALLKIVDIKTGEATTVQKLTVDLIKAEINHVDCKLNGRK